MNVDLAARQESLNAEYVNDHTALSAALDVTLNNLLVVEGCVDTLPRLAEASLLVGEHELTLGILLVLYVNLNLVTNLQLGIVTELGSGDDTVALVTDVYNHFLLVGSDNGTFYYLMLAYLVECFVIRLLEVVFADVSACAILKLVPIEVVQWLYVL